MTYVCHKIFGIMARQRKGPIHPSIDDGVGGYAQGSQYNQHISHDFHNFDDDYYSANHDMDGVSLSKYTVHAPMWLELYPKQ